MPGPRVRPPEPAGGGEAAGDQCAEPGVSGWIEHHHRRVVLHADRFEFSVGHRQAATRDEVRGVGRGLRDMVVPAEHVVVGRRIAGGFDVVHGILVAQPSIGGERIAPGIGGAENETPPRPETLSRSCLMNRTSTVLCQQLRGRVFRQLSLRCPPPFTGRRHAGSHDRAADRVGVGGDQGRHA